MSTHQEPVEELVQVESEPVDRGERPKEVDTGRRFSPIDPMREVMVEDRGACLLLVCPDCKMGQEPGQMQPQQTCTECGEGLFQEIPDGGRDEPVEEDRETVGTEFQTVPEEPAAEQPRPAEGALRRGRGRGRGASPRTVSPEVEMEQSMIRALSMRGPRASSETLARRNRRGGEWFMDMPLTQVPGGGRRGRNSPSPSRGGSIASSVGSGSSRWMDMGIDVIDPHIWPLPSVRRYRLIAGYYRAKPRPVHTAMFPECRDW